MFTPKITNPIKNNVPATEIMLNDRLITNNELKDFFINIPKRLDIIELADDVSDNLDALALTSDVDECKSNISELQEDIKTISDSVESLQNLMGEKLISGTVQYNVKQLWDVVFGTEGLIEYITDVQDDYLDTKNNVIPEIQSAIESIKDELKSLNEFKDSIDKRVLAVENKITNIDVITAQNNLLSAQIEQIRSECNNTLASYNSRLLAIEERIGLV